MIFLLLILLIPIIAYLWVKYNYRKYKGVPNAKGVTGCDVARMILDKHGLDTVKVLEVKGTMSDHYNPKKGRKTVNLSDDVYNGTSIASLAIAAHECGHALQDKDGYVYMNMRSALVPFVNGISYLAYIGIFVSIFFEHFDWIVLAILSLIATLAFQIVTLPVEFDASKRAKAELKSMGIVNNVEGSGVNAMLKSAALTYVAAVAVTCFQLIRLLFLRRR